tara:strand:+ start:830 stop:1321 length:492 start_codon:yes stop_codon:yes gene_type:complete
MNKLLTVCLLSLSISTTALATEEAQGSIDKVPQTFSMVADTEQPVTIAEVSEAQVEIPEGNDIQEALSLGMEMLDAINAGKFQLVLGLLLMILIWGLRTFWGSFPVDAVPWIAAGIATVGAAAVGMISGWPWEKILTDALTVSTSAGGLWSLVGKHISNLGKK